MLEFPSIHPITLSLLRHQGYVLLQLFGALIMLEVVDAKMLSEHWHFIPGRHLLQWRRGWWGKLTNQNRSMGKKRFLILIHDKTQLKLDIQNFFINYVCTDITRFFCCCWYLFSFLLISFILNLNITTVTLVLWRFSRDALSMKIS